MKLVNETLQRLADSRVGRIDVEGILAQSKLAWMAAVLHEAILYRIVALGQGAALAWNAGNWLTCFLTARALVETMVLTEDIHDQIEVALVAENLELLGQLLRRQTFASRDEEWLARSPADKATNILTLLDRFSKKVLPQVRKHYDSLSERCHPNRMGHTQMFSTLDTATGTVTLSDAKNEVGNKVAITRALMLLRIFEDRFARLQEQTERIAALQHRLEPIGGAA